jgi:hypothetical protein
VIESQSIVGVLEYGGECLEKTTWPVRGVVVFDMIANVETLAFIDFGLASRGESLFPLLGCYSLSSHNSILDPDALSGH